jgi:succinoglycan biosynthesis protein ExoM
MLLVQTLRSLYSQRLDKPFAVLVCDNDAQSPLGESIFDAKPDGCTAPTAYVVEPEIGISQARNAMCAKALALWPDARWIAMVDDDEIADHGWLAALLAMGESYDADVVSGHQIYDVPAEAPDWLRVVAFDYGLPWQRTGPARIASTTGNVLLRADLLRRMGQPLFDPTYARTGGSDYEFFVRAKKGGAAFAHAVEARTFEFVDERRREFAWWWRRSVRHGATYARTHCAHRPWPLAIAREAVTAGLRIVRACAILLASPRPGRLQRAGMLIGWVVGQVRAAGGLYGDEYGDRAARTGTASPSSKL